MNRMAIGEADGLRDTLHRQEELGPYWRKQAFATFANYVFCEHILPFQNWYTESAICDRLNRLNIPVYRGCGPWTPDKIAGIRKALPKATRHLVDKQARCTVS